MLQCKVLCVQKSLAILNHNRGMQLCKNEMMVKMIHRVFVYLYQRLRLFNLKSWGGGLEKSLGGGHVNRNQGWGVTARKELGRRSRKSKPGPLPLDFKWNSPL